MTWGVISGLTYSASKGKADELTTRSDIERQRLTVNEKAIETQIAVATDEGGAGAGYVGSEAEATGCPERKGRH